MLADARAKVPNPNATFQKADVYEIEFPAASFDAITVFFSLIAGVSQAGIKRQIGRMYEWLRPGGVLVFASVPVSIDEQVVKFLGRWFVGSSFSVEEYLEGIAEAGFEVVGHSVNTFKPRGVEEAGLCEEGESREEPQVFVYARKES